ncbi:DUF2844 domain-containing protein [Noviherbaspirillum sp. UKPF54]|uniref:DUF2844 domain-containing protein n=1 Tax=Noviherbaspirillum sp. UKPF54 TaxID=2601898 RepID=UPI0011B14E44|nr:DUF2844 domain-containing protein [Noviherbaspirillum sp. UKPF54]QDZ27845.1 DUF2844 domain-containing protein [Noviherbaspirillum sp. UKPF54]
MIEKNLMAAVAAAAFCISGLAHAALGGTVESVQADKSAMHAKAQVMPGAGSYSVHEIQLPSGTVVREYVSLDGKVFAIAWEGPSLPDIRQLLGAYFDRFATAMQGKHRAQRHAVVSQPDLVIQSHGRMGAFSGRAYLPQALPQGVGADVVQ